MTIIATADADAIICQHFCVLVVPGGDMYYEAGCHIAELRVTANTNLGARETASFHRAVTERSPLRQTFYIVFAGSQQRELCQAVGPLQLISRLLFKWGKACPRRHRAHGYDPSEVESRQNKLAML